MQTCTLESVYKCWFACWLTVTSHPSPSPSPSPRISTPILISSQPSLTNQSRQWRRARHRGPERQPIQSCWTTCRKSPLLEALSAKGVGPVPACRVAMRRLICLPMSQPVLNRCTKETILCRGFQNLLTQSSSHRLGKNQRKRLLCPRPARIDLTRGAAFPKLPIHD